MRRESRSGLAVLALSLVLALAGCGRAQQEAQEGSAQAVVTLPQGLSASDVTRVELTVSGAGMTTRTDALVKTGGQWGGVLGQLPAGTGRTFSAQAFDASNTVRYAGQVTPVTIQAHQTSAVTLLLQEVNAPPPFDNAAPRILSLVASPGTVAPGGQVALQATAEDPNAGDTLTYAWTASTGSFSGPASLTTAWTAPTSAGPVVLTLMVTDSKGASTALSVTVTVSTGNGSAAVNVSFNTWPQVASITATPTSVAVGQATQVTASASDSDGDSLTYQWTASCAGTWTSATSASASFTPSEVPSSSTCTLSVAARDGRGGVGIGSLTVYVATSPGTARFPPEIVETFQSVASVPTDGGTVVFRVRAADPQGSTLSFAWATSTGTLGTAMNTATTSEVLWTAPSCVPPGPPPTVTATVTNALGLSASHAFSLQGDTVCAVGTTARLAGGGSHTLALKQDGTVWAWGYNGIGQLGDGTINTYRPASSQVPGLTGVVAVAAGKQHSMALKVDGTVWAWGGNDWGQLGVGTGMWSTTPIAVPALTGVAALAAGHGHTLALKQDGTVWAWGRNDYGQLGDGTTTYRPIPSRLPGLSGVVALIAGDHHALVMKQDGTVWAWGYNGWGQLGDGTTTHRLTPVQVTGLSGVAALVAGQYHSLALKQDGTVWAWGRNFEGQLGDATATSRSTPVQVPGLTDVATLAAGGVHTLALKQDGTIWAWGSNGSGELGDGTTMRRLSPVQVPNLTSVAAVSTGWLHSLALKSDGTVWAWGRNDFGELGDGTTTTRLSPAQVPDLNL
ncbi:MAG: kelch-like protein [Myxococcaceae bacterium]|nr:MAG: kelch-like protein [Myxococcaceae bacterium]